MPVKTSAYTNARTSQNISFIQSRNGITFTFPSLQYWDIVEIIGIRNYLLNFFE
jgi:hypothetical protein